MLIDKLTNDLKAARLARNSHAVLYMSLIIGDLKSKAPLIDGEKVVTDDAVITYAKKYLGNLEEVRRLDTAVTDVDGEYLYVESLLPKQLTEDELAALVTGNLSIGEYMKFLKDNYAGQYDGKLAAKVWKGVCG